ncbi:MAG: serine/threonine protein kinase [Planctomycetes bacterium]|nr:serine/threonine protein kinase [Planctomycetota bacterium]
MTNPTASPEMIFYISNGGIGAIRPDGTGESYPQFAGQVEYVFPGGKQAVFHSQDPPKDPKAAYDHPDGRGFARTHLWLYDFATKAIREIELPTYMRLVGLIPGQDRFLISGNTNHVFTLFSCDLNGGNRDMIYTGPGYAYGTSISPDGRSAAFHITGTPGRPGYEIYVIDLVTKQRTLISGDHELLQFGPFWSPDGQWLVYQRCLYRQDPGHDRSDVVVSRPDGSEHRVLTSGQSHWFATSYGIPGRHGSGSNMPIWSPDGRVTCALLLPDSRSPWPWAVGRPDTDHFNRDYRPEQARGGTRICLIDIHTGKITPITHDDPPTWNFRLCWSPDGKRLAFIKADVGKLSELWVMDADGSNRRLLTRGANGLGVDHPRWVRLAVASV